MSAPLAVWPDVELLVVELLKPTGNAGGWKPADLTDQLPFRHVYRFAGADDGITDRPVIGIDTFAVTRHAGWLLAQQDRQLLLATPHAITVDQTTKVIDTVTTSEAPHEVPYGDSQVRRWVSSYTVSLRR